MKITFLSLFLSTILLFVSCAGKATPAQTEVVLGTVCTINVFEQGNPALYKKLFDSLRLIEHKMSARLSDSEISLVNAAAGKNAVAVSAETFYVVEQALVFARESGGAFDPSIGPLVNLWGIGTENERVPDVEEIKTALELVNWALVEISAAQKTIFLKKEGMSLDVGGIAKGYAADVLAEELEKAGVKRALIDLGGNIYALGSRSDGSPWRIGVKDPLAPQDNPVLRVDVTNKSVVTSGMYERFFIQDDVRYHHILNPKTGYPVDNGTLSVTIVDKSSLRADALSTTCFVLGAEKGISFTSRFKDSEAICITAEREVVTTSEIAVKILDDSLSFRN